MAIRKNNRPVSRRATNIEDVPLDQLLGFAHDDADAPQIPTAASMEQNEQPAKKRRRTPQRTEKKNEKPAAQSQPSRAPRAKKQSAKSEAASGSRENGSLPPPEHAYTDRETPSG